MGKENDKCACVTKLFICSLKDRTAKNLQNAHATEFLLLFAPVLVVQSCNAHMPAARNLPGFGPYVPRRCIDTGVEVGVAGDLTLWIFKICSKKRLFGFSFCWEQQNFIMLVHSRKILEKYPSGPPGHAHAWFIWHEILVLVACLQISDCSELRCFKKKVVTIEVMQSCKSHLLDKSHYLLSHAIPTNFEAQVFSNLVRCPL